MSGDGIYRNGGYGYNNEKYAGKNQKCLVHKFPKQPKRICNHVPFTLLLYTMIINKIAYFKRFFYSEKPKNEEFCVKMAIIRLFRPPAYIDISLILCHYFTDLKG